jgi:hypothetical protein
MGKGPGSQADSEPQRLSLPSGFSKNDITPLIQIFKQISESPDGSIPADIQAEARDLQTALAPAIPKILVSSLGRVPKIFEKVIKLPAPTTDNPSGTVQDWIIATTDRLITAANHNADGSIIRDETAKKAFMSEAFSQTQAGKVLEIVLPLQGYIVEKLPGIAVAG